MALLPQLAVWQAWSPKRRAQACRGARAILGWLAAFPGQGWQQRWHAASADAGVDWLRAVPLTSPGAASSGNPRGTSHNGLAGLLLCRAVLPSYPVLAEYAAQTLFTEARRVFQPDIFATMTGHAAASGMPGHRIHDGLNVITKLVLHTGLDIRQLSFPDFEEYRTWGRQRYGANPPAILPAWDLLRGIGIVPSAASYRAMQAQGQRPTADLVDRYQIRCTPVRDALIRYLDERRPAMDYKSFLNLTGLLAGTFWADIEAHHPGIASLHLPADAAAEWKQRLQHWTGRDGRQRPRERYLPVLMQVRSFYLDIAEWATQDPTWAAHAVPCPVRRGDTAGWARQQRRTTAAIHQRIRERLPQLPVLAAAAESRRATQQALLAAAQATSIGDAFECDGTRYRRILLKSHAKRRKSRPPGAVLAEDLTTGKVTDLTQSEDEAFWAWAIIETLRHTGVRLEELLEISHLALVSYQLPRTGELVPLLQILPSKSDQERLLLISPELASVLATIISRLRGAGGGTIPLVSQYDRLERVFRPMLPLLFQRRTGHRNEAISVSTIQELLNATLDCAGLRDAAGQPLRFTPHDFRRMFATEAVTGGLPVHITARLLGHASIATTEAYLAVFHDELINTYRVFLDQRRALRPQAEYREPTSQEWREFEQHFALRKVGLGTCGRPYGTPCKHEHACVRCPMLRIDPAQRGRLTAIIANLTDRIAEARTNGWLGEAHGLQVSLHAAQAKLAALDRVRNRAPAATTDLGIPQIRHTSPNGGPP